MATYSHHEVIPKSWWDENLFWIRDFDDRTICQEPRDGLRVVRQATAEILHKAIVERGEVCLSKLPGCADSV
ncbi:MAG TPA: hypothetical protein VFP80_06365 [Thermoanaerobaculia bacterium]|nr:hypothetical protein [Thermoanaerobaculia bacterium]